jgi:hypothetical protein
MRLLVANLAAYANYVSREFACIMQELIGQYGWRHLDPATLDPASGSLSEEIMRRFRTLPELTLFWEGEQFCCSRAREIESLPCVKWFFVDDLHTRGRLEERRKAALLCDTVFASYGDQFAEFFPDVARGRRVIWLPHSASPDFALPINVRAANSLLLSGAIGPPYPLREQARKLMEEGFQGIVQHVHPGYHCDYDHDRHPGVGPGYARKIWAFRAALTDGSVRRYAVAKHFEIPATGALLVAEASIDPALGQLGFVPGVHYLSVRADQLEDQVASLRAVENHAALDQIRRAGQALVQERHCTTHRAALLQRLAGALSSFQPVDGPRAEVAQVRA